MLEILEDEGLAPIGTTWASLVPESSAILRVVTLDRVIEHGDGDPLNDSPWRSQQRFAWVLKDLVSIEPVSCRGAQKLWMVPEDVKQIVRIRYDEAISGKSGW